MATEPLLKRGFKAKAEKLAIEYREKLLLHACAPICAFKLAANLNVPIYSATEFLTLPDEMTRLAASNGDACGWSALTMTTKANNKIIIHNPYHSAARQQSNIMHELAHIICLHKIKELDHSTPVPIGMRHFDEIEEEEAKCLGATLQISRPALLWSIKRKMNNTEIAAHFNASAEMVAYRLNTSGVTKQSYYINKKNLISK